MLLSKTFRSSTLKISFIYVLVFSCAIFGVLVYVYWSTVAYLDEMLDQSVKTETAALIETFSRSGRIGLISQINARVSDKFFDSWVYLLTDKSLGYVAGNLKSWPTAALVEQEWREFTPADWHREPSKPPLLRAADQVLPDGYHLLVGRKLHDLARYRDNILISLIWVAGSFLILAAAAGISTSRRSVARIEAINATSRKIIETGLQGRIPLRGTGDEWDGLAQNLNSMLDRIEDLVETNRQVSHNVAHDLRTPLTRVRGRLERTYNQQLAAEEYHALIGGVIADLDEILRIFSSLLRIAQIETRDRVAGFRDIDLAGIVHEVAELFDPTAEESGVRMQLAASDRVHVIGDRDLLFDAISNLVDNAIKHGGRNGRVIISVAQARHSALLSIADCGPGIPTGERTHVLRRFYRLEGSRNSPGSGLGLSLVAAVAHLHGARIEMVDNSPGLRVELHFPKPETGMSEPLSQQAS